jgi:hypothetical protein
MKQNSTKGILRVIQKQNYSNDYVNSDPHYHFYPPNFTVTIAEITTLDKKEILVSKDLIPFDIINSINNSYINDGDVMNVYLNDEGGLKLSKLDKACVQKYIPKMFTEDEVLSLIEQLMHQVHLADEEIIVSDKYIDFKLSPMAWFNKFAIKK